MLQEYKSLFETMVINVKKLPDIDYAMNKIAKNKGRYTAVAEMMGNGMPWWFVGLPHVMEKGGSFSHHLHNGDPLTARTVNVPMGRPAVGKPPFTWEASALDALKYVMHFDAVKDWSLPNCLYLLEKYNGMGYRNLEKRKIPFPNINTPYLWSFTNHYVKGKFVKDGVYDPNYVSNQPGCAAIIKRMQDKGII